MSEMENNNGGDAMNSCCSRACTTETSNCLAWFGTWLGLALRSIDLSNPVEKIYIKFGLIYGLGS